MTPIDRISTKAPVLSDMVCLKRLLWILHQVDEKVDRTVQNNQNVGEC